jgi:hypothetical protein
MPMTIAAAPRPMVQLRRRNVSLAGTVRHRLVGSTPRQCRRPERLREIRDGAKSQSAGLGERAREHRIHTFAEADGHRGSRRDARECGGDGVACERVPARQQLLRNHRERELISRGIDVEDASLDLFGGHVLRRTANQPGRLETAVPPRDAEVEDLHQLGPPPLDGDQDHVVGLQIAVHDAMAWAADSRRRSGR